MTHAERQMIVLPCSHLIDRPVRSAARVECTADKRVFDLYLEAGGRVWNAREVVDAH